MTGPADTGDAGPRVSATAEAPRLGPLSFARLDAELAARIAAGDRLPGIAARALATIAVGGAAYGAVFGIWRAPEAALGSALKLPLVFLGVVAATTLASALLAPALRSRLDVRRASVAALVSFATTATVLAAVAPAMLLVVLTQRPSGAGALGLQASDLVGAPSTAVAQALVLAHTAVIAAAGIAGVLRLLALLERLGDAPAIARRVVVAWLGAQFLVGAELSWRLRPFLGAPTRPVRFFAADAFEGSFFEEIGRLGGARFGGAAPLVLGLVALGVGVWLRAALRPRPDHVRVHAEPDALFVVATSGARQAVRWRAVRRVHAEGATLIVTLAPDAALDEHRLWVPCASPAAAAALAARIERARASAAGGPFRVAAA